MIFTTDINTSGAPAEGELELINKLTVKQMSADEIYAFSVVLCDNEVDRDFERFDISAIEKLSKLFVGKPGIFDHSMSGKDQTARVFSCEVVTDPTRKTSAGEAYTKLVARAYMPRSEKNAALIEEIDAGIKKEASVGCSAGSSICSVCGKDTRRESCPHIKGKVYNGKVCHRIIKNPTDAYEWSFVAVPAQREAGVTKSYRELREDNAVVKTVRLLSRSGDDVMISKDEAKKLSGYISQLESLAQQGEEYRDELLCEVIRMGAAALPAMRGESLSAICKTLDLEQLKELKSAFSKSGAGLKSQLTARDVTPSAANNEFKI